MSEQGKLAPEGKCMGLVFKDGYEFARFIEDICWIVGNVQRFPGGAVVKNLPADAGDARYVGSIPGSERSPGGGHSNPLQCSCLENPMDREPGGLESVGSQRVRHD